MSNKWRSVLGLVSIIVVGVLFLTGCVTIRSETVIKLDGSGTRNIILAIDKEMMALAQAGQGTIKGTPTAGSEDPFAEVEKSVSKIPGATVEKYSDPSGKEGIKVVVPFKSLDELTQQTLGESPDKSMDKISYSQDGSVITLNIQVNTSEVASGASSASGSSSAKATPSPEDQALVTQMMAGMGFEFSYAVAVPGKILDWSPKDNASYDPKNNEVLWKIDLTSGSMPNIMIKWDNAQKPEGLAKPGPGAANMGTSTTVTTSQTVEQVKKYADAVMKQDQAAYTALMASGQIIPHPLMEKYPDIFGASDLSVVYTTAVADETTGYAEWTAQWTANGKTHTLNGVDVLTFDSKGKITAIKAFVDPAEFLEARK